ncbi:MAG: insulinase family protein [Bacteroidetes bacterium]|nr:insulinase family protein [Bacteroidota bacterium]
MIGINRKTQPKINLLDNFNFQAPEFFKLDNGIPVYQIHTGTQDITKIEFIFKAGSWFEEKPLIAKFTNKMLKEGTRSFTSEQLHEKVDFYGAHLETSSDKDMAYVVLYSLNRHLLNILPVFEEVIFQPVFPEKELSIRIQNKKQEFLINCEKVKYVARWKFNELIFGKSHPYGRFFGISDFDDITSSDLSGFHEKNYTVCNCTIIVAGKVPGNIIALLNQYFGKYHRNPSDNINPENKISPQNKSRVHIHKDNAIQSAIRIGKVLINKMDPDYIKLKILNTLFGGYFGSRLMTNIREEKGYTYGIGSSLVSLQNSGFFFISSEVGSEVTQQAINEIYLEIEKLQDDLVSMKELGLVQNYMLGTFLRNLDGPFALSESYKSLIEYGLDSGYLKNYVHAIKTVKPEELRLLAQKYLDRNTLYEIKVGK